MMTQQTHPMMMMENTAESLLDRFEQYSAPKVKKWIGPEET